MKKVYNLFTVALVVALIMVGCNVDDTYDLSNLDTSEIGIGTDETSFDFPLAEVVLNVENLIGNNSSLFTTNTRADYSDIPTIDDVDIPTIDDVEIPTTDEDAWLEELFGDETETDTATETSGTVASELLNKVSDLVTFLPSSYEDGIQLNMLSDEEYTSDLIADLLTELSEDSETRDSFCEFMVESAQDYPSVWESLEEALPDVDLSDTTEFSGALGDLLNDPESADIIAEIKSSVVTTVNEETADFETSFVIEESFDDAIDIDESTMSMIDSNLDGDKNTLSILFILTTDVPVSMTFTPYIVLGDGSRITIGDYSDAEAIASNITAENFREMLSSLSIAIEVEFTTYNPSEGDLNLEDKTLSIKLIARKTGSLKF